MKRVSALPIKLAIILFSFLSLLPFYIMFVMGTYVNEELFTGVKLLPGNYLLGNLKSVLGQNFGNVYLNSIYITLTVTISATFISALAGFAFAKYKFRFKKVLFFFVLGTMMVPAQLGLVGFVVEMRWFHMMNTHWPLILPAFANAFGVYWMKSYIGGAIPNELLESSRVDGSTDFRTFIQIVLPVIKPAMITIFLMSFLTSWNSYLLPLVVLDKEKLYTIPLAISMLGNAYRTDYAARILALTLTTMPVIIIFSFGSKYLIQGLVVGSVKE